MNITFLCFGNKLMFHIQTYFAILTVLKHKDKDDTVTIYTDYPEYYRRLEQLIKISVFDQNKLDGWINGTGHIFRAKIKAIQESAQNNPDSHLLFLDGDTCLVNDISNIKKLLDKGYGVMHKDEGHPSKMRGKSLQMWNAIKGTDIGTSCISMKHNVWNSGVIGIPQDKLNKVIPLTLDVCDMILKKNVNCFTTEQYSFSIVMREYCDLYEATPWVRHYWGNKEGWFTAIHDFLLTSHTNGWTIEEELANLDISSFEKIPFYVKKSNTRRRLTGIIDKIFPDKNQ